MCFLMIYMFNENKKKNSIFLNSPKKVQKDLTVPLRVRIILGLICHVIIASGMAT